MADRISRGTQRVTPLELFSISSSFLPLLRSPHSFRETPRGMASYGECCSSERCGGHGLPTLG
jgi:hypothetical protein